MSACRHPGVPEDCHGRHHSQTAAARIIDRRSVNGKDTKYLGWQAVRHMRIAGSIDLVQWVETRRTRTRSINHRDRWLNVCAWESRKKLKNGDFKYSLQKPESLPSEDQKACYMTSIRTFRNISRQGSWKTSPGEPQADWHLVVWPNKVIHVMTPLQARIVENREYTVSVHWAPRDLRYKYTQRKSIIQFSIFCMRHHRDCFQIMEEIPSRSWSFCSCF